MHLGVYRRFPDVQAIIHTHTTFTNAYFLSHEAYTPRTFEGEYMLGQVRGVEQDYVNVRDIESVLQALGSKGIAALRRHGVVASGRVLFDCFARIQVLEEQLKMEAFSRIFSATKNKC